MARNDKVVTVFGDMEHENSRYLFEDNPWDHWQHMPSYDPKNIASKDAYLTVEITFEDADAVTQFSELLDHPITEQTKSTWFPKKNHDKYVTGYLGEHQRNDQYLQSNYPKYPIYIVSKTRWAIRLTSDSLIEMGIKHYMIVEESQYEKYKQHTDPTWVTLLILPQKYLDDYDTCDDLGSTKSKGPGAARNFAWDHSISIGAKRHWVMDDNQKRFFRSNSDKRYYAMSGAIFRAMEDHTDRFENVYISGPHYRFFVVPDENRPPFVQNCRIYSTLLILNDIPYRWRGRYNEDTDLSLRVLKDGFCTIQYNAFSTGKLVTQAVAGGNTAEFYAKEGTLPKSEMIERLHPDVAKVVWMNNRWHHFCDYSIFKKNRLIPVKNPCYNSDSEYGMSLGKLDFVGNDDAED